MNYFTSEAKQTDPPEPTKCVEEGLCVKMYKLSLDYLSSADLNGEDQPTSTE